jgi:hypothetical protein
MGQAGQIESAVPESSMDDGQVEPGKVYLTNLNDVQTLGGVFAIQFEVDVVCKHQNASVCGTFATVTVT